MKIDVEEGQGEGNSSEGRYTGGNKNQKETEREERHC